MKKELLEYIIRETVKEVLEAFPQEQDTIGAPAPPAGGLGTADQPALDQGGTGMTPDARGIWYVDPKNPNKPIKVQIRSQDPASLERELRAIAKSGGQGMKVSADALQKVPQVVANPNSVIYLYVGKKNPADTLPTLMTAPSYQRAKTATFNPNAQPQDIQGTMPAQPQPDTPKDEKTKAPDINESSKFKNMISLMIKEALQRKKQ